MEPLTVVLQRRVVMAALVAAVGMIGPLVARQRAGRVIPAAAVVERTVAVTMLAAAAAVLEAQVSLVLGLLAVLVGQVAPQV